MGRVGRHGLVSSHNARNGPDALEVIVDHGVLVKIQTKVAGPRQTNVQIQITNAQLSSNNELLVLEIDIVEVGEFGVGSLDEIVAHLLWDGGVEEITDNFVVFCSNEAEGLVDQISINRTGSWQDGMRGILVSDPDQSGGILIQNGPIVKNDSWDIALGVDGVEVHSGCGLVSAKIDLFRF